MSVVLDSAAILALVLREPGWDRVEAALDGAVLSTISLGEVYRKLPAAGGRQLPVLLRAQGVEVLPLTEEHAFLQARVPNVTEHEVDGRRKRKRLGWGDRVVAALGQLLGLPVLTVDRGLMALGDPYRFVTFR